MVRTRLEDIQVSEDWTGFSQKDLVKTLSELQDKTISDLRVLQDAQGRLAKHAARSLSINKELKRRTKLRTSSAQEALESAKKSEKAEKPILEVKKGGSSDPKGDSAPPDLRRSKRRRTAPNSDTESEAEKEPRAKKSCSNHKIEKKPSTVDLTVAAERTPSETSETVKEKLEKHQAGLDQEVKELERIEAQILEDLANSTKAAVSESAVETTSVEKRAPLPEIGEVAPETCSEEKKIREEQNLSHADFLDKSSKFKLTEFLALVHKYSGPDGPTREGYIEACKEFESLPKLLGHPVKPKASN